MPVRILDENVVNKIAAGEVVERPASVVKELVENSLDAKATELRVHLKAGGRGQIRIVDDGIGMNRSDAVMSLERHATSKIQNDADLFRVNTLGFRGEAIPSIASISRFEMITRPHDAEMGTRVLVEGGSLKAVEAAGCAPGTDIRISSIFYNVPARRKFLRSAETELSHCLEAITREALIRPHLDLEVTHDERELIRCPRVQSRHQRAADLLGAHGSALVPANFRRSDIEVEALISPVGVHRSSAQGSSYLYVNGRYVRDNLLRKAVSMAYAGIVPKDRYPVVVLELRLPPSEVDVNVHPAKVEVRFVHAMALMEALASGLRQALTDHGIHRPVENEARYRPPEAVSTQMSLAPMELRSPENEETTEAEAQTDEDRPENEGPHEDPPEITHHPRQPSDPQDQAPIFHERPPMAPPRPTPPPMRPPPVEAPPIEARPAEARPLPAPSVGVSALPPGLIPRLPTAARPAETRPLLPTRRYRDLRVIGQLSNTYILCEGAGELLIVDQHAAHERVNLERLEKDKQAALGPSQRLLTPIMVELAPARARALASALEGISSYGLELRFLGGGTFAVQAVPPALRKEDLGTLLADAADDVVAGGPGKSPEERVQRVLATMACHASVRAGQPLSLTEMTDLLKALDVVDFGVCAHGRPVVVRLDLAELERRFHRS